MRTSKEQGDYDCAVADETGNLANLSGSEVVIEWS